MCLDRVGEAGDEVRQNVDQFLRIEANHPDGTVHKIRAEEEAAEALEYSWNGLVVCVHTRQQP